jgi:hypothetical protein
MLVSEHPITLDEIQTLANYLSRCPYGEVEPLVAMLRGVAKRPMPHGVAVPRADEITIPNKPLKDAPTEEED